MNRLSPVFKAMADEKRLQIMTLLSENQYCVCALSNLLKISQSAISQHLKILREAELVRGEKRGYYTHYIVCYDKIRNIGDILHTFVETGNATLCSMNCPLTTDIKEKQMKETKCKNPEKLKGKPGECSPDQIQECHGDEAVHECEESEVKCKNPEKLKGKPGECSPDQIQECHGVSDKHECT